MRAWLFSIARYIVVDYQRKMSRRKDISIDEVEIPDRLSIEEEAETKRTGLSPLRCLLKKNLVMRNLR